MNLRFFLTPALLLVTGSAGLLAGDKQPEPAVPVTQTLPAAPRPTAAPDQQRLYGPGATMVEPEKANQVVDAFRAAYEKLGKPRLLLYVNRDLVDERAGLKLTGRKEKTETTLGERKSSFEAAEPSTAPAGTPQTQVNVAVGGGSVGAGQADQTPGRGSSENRTTTVTGENSYSADESSAATLADKLTVREIETLCGRPFRIAGATLADQKTAASLLADKPIDHFTTATNDAARKDREALARIADVVIEVLVSSRTVTVAGVSGDRSVTLPDIQATAIRLSDSAILGQASASDVIGKDRFAARVVNQFDARDITEATALALMEDMTQASK